jgi:hypothetical protein
MSVEGIRRSKWDWFHPNVNGQHELAAVTWRAGFFD